MGLSTSRRPRSLLGVAVLSLLAFFLLAVVAPTWQPARAQDQPAAGAEGGGAPAPAQSQSLFWYLVTSAGPIFGPLLLLVFIAMVALIVLLAMDLRMATSIPPDFVEEFTDTVNKRRFKEAFELARNDNSFLGRVLTAGMGRLQYGIEDAREIAFNTVESIKAGKEQLLAYLAAIGTLGPMIGLVGTVFGMILSFMVLGQEGATPKPSELAKGISHALVITLLGIGVSIPAIAAHTFFRNRLIRISTDAANISDDLLTQMYHFSRKPAAEAKPAAAASANTEGRAVAAKPAT